MSDSGDSTRSLLCRFPEFPLTTVIDNGLSSSSSSSVLSMQMAMAALWRERGCSLSNSGESTRSLLCRFPEFPLTIVIDNGLSSSSSSSVLSMQMGLVALWRERGFSLSDCGESTQSLLGLLTGFLEASPVGNPKIACMSSKIDKCSI